MASLTFGAKKGATALSPLQSADIVAYESMKEMVRRVNPLNSRGARLSGINLASDRARNQWLYCGEYDFVQSIKNAELRAIDYETRHPRK